MDNKWEMFEKIYTDILFLCNEVDFFQIKNFVSTEFFQTSLI